MTIRTLDVGNLFSILGAGGTQKRQGRIDRVGRVSVNAVSDSATVAYDASRTNLSAVMTATKACGFSCAGEAMLKLVCQDHAEPVKSASGRDGPVPAEAHGDHAGSAGQVFADVLHGDKASKVKELQAQRRKVGMVGDGVNDAPTLTQVDVGFAIGAGTDVAMASADIVLIKSDPFDVVGAVELSLATLGKIHQNLPWAVGYNVIALMLKRTKLTGIHRPGEAPAASPSATAGATAAA